MKDKDIELIREFNRFYTGIIGLLDEHILQSPYSLPEARVLYELHHRQPCSAKDLTEAINMDKGYLSRVLNTFAKTGLVIKKQSKEDGRATVLSLTAKGEKEFELINAASASQLSGMLASLNESNVKKLLSHMAEIKKLLTQNEQGNE